MTITNELINFQSFYVENYFVDSSNTLDFISYNKYRKVKPITALTKEELDRYIAELEEIGVVSEHSVKAYKFVLSLLEDCAIECFAEIMVSVNRIFFGDYYSINFKKIFVEKFFDIVKDIKKEYTDEELIRHIKSNSDFFLCELQNRVINFIDTSKASLKLMPSDPSKYPLVFVEEENDKTFELSKKAKYIIDRVDDLDIYDGTRIGDIVRKIKSSGDEWYDMLVVDVAFFDDVELMFKEVKPIQLGYDNNEIQPEDILKDWDISGGEISVFKVKHIELTEIIE